MNRTLPRTLHKAQGWYRDPYRQHVARWFSDGSPTALVRDDGVESMDPPPEHPFVGPLEAADESEGELLHAHVGPGQDRPDASVRGAWEIFVSTGGD
jgi:hypothetical protein